MKYLITAFLTLVVASQTVAQTNYQSDSLFFQKGLTMYQQWLDSTNLSSILTIKEFTIEEAYLSLICAVPSKDEWIILRNEYRETAQQELGIFLFQKFTFLMEIPRKAAVIQIIGNQDNYEVQIEAPEGQIMVEEPLPNASLRGGIKVSLKKINGNGTAKTTRTLKQTKSLIKNYFRGHYEMQSVWGKSTNFEVIEFNDILTMEVTNIKREVLYDFTIGYFELILIDMQFEEKEDFLEIKYTIQGKYGSGVFIAPRRSGYKDMEPKFIDYLDRYRKKFRSKLEEILESEMIRN